MSDELMEELDAEADRLSESMPGSLFDAGVVARMALMKRFLPPPGPVKKLTGDVTAFVAARCAPGGRSGLRVLYESYTDWTHARVVAGFEKHDAPRRHAIRARSSYRRAMDDAGIEALVDAIKHLHGCEATHVETAHVREVFDGATVWEGDVEVFKIEGHATAKHAYAWSHATVGAKRKFYAVLGVPPVDSAAAAVKASIVRDHQLSKN